MSQRNVGGGGAFRVGEHMVYNLVAACSSQFVLLWLRDGGYFAW